MNNFAKIISFAVVALAAAFLTVEAAEIDVVVIGPIVKTQHQVSGQVYALNDSIIIIDGFNYDGLAPGVFFNVATQGNSVQQYLQNRVIVNYPDPNSPVSTPLEGRISNKRIFLQMPPGLRVRDIKWMTIWCELFGVSFGEVTFPAYVRDAFL